MNIGSVRENTQESRGKIKNHKIEQGSNLFRILPPMWSLSTAENLPPQSQYSKFWKVHWGFTTSKGSPRPILCTERVNKDKVVIERCPICDMVTEAQRELEFMKVNGASKQQIKEFEDARITPYRQQRHNYLWALDANGTIGLLKVGKTVIDEIEELRKKLKDQGIELMGKNGAYINITKSGSGKFGTTYKTELAFEADPNSPGSFKYKMHTLTPDIINRLSKETRDLATLYSPMSVEDMAMLVNTPLNQRGELLEKVLNSNVSKSEVAQTLSTIPGTRATEVSSVSINQQSQTLQGQSFSNPGAISSPQAVAPQGQAAPQQPTTQAPVAPAATGEVFESEEEFMASFNARFRK